jgi:hypothetical protein
MSIVMINVTQKDGMAVAVLLTASSFKDANCLVAYNGLGNAYRISVRKSAGKYLFGKPARH